MSDPGSIDAAVNALDARYAYFERDGSRYRVELTNLEPGQPEMLHRDLGARTDEGIHIHVKTESIERIDQS